jgi:hypothetical protein
MLNEIGIWSLGFGIWNLINEIVTHLSVLGMTLLMGD